MKLSPSNYLLICLLGLAVPAFAERVTLTNLSDTGTHQSFTELAQYHNSPASPQRLNATQRAFKALLTALTPAIKNLTNYTGIFAGNCSVFFEDAIESAACDLNATQTRAVELGARYIVGTHLPKPYWHQITLSNILLATVFADWTHGTTQSYRTDLYFKQGTCSDSITMSESRTGSLSKTGTVSLLLSPSTSLLKTATSSQSLSKEQAHTQSLPASMTLSDESTRSSGSSQSLSLSDEPTLSKTVSAESTISALLSASATLTQTATLAPTIVSTEWANWIRTTGVYNNGASQIARFTTTSGVVTDSYTGLQWEAAGSTGTYTWSAAQASGSAQGYCAARTTGGFTDWRLPARVELQTLVDYTTSSPAINVAVFPSTQSDLYWTFTPFSLTPGLAWNVNFYDGLITSPENIGNSNYVRCVRLGLVTTPPTRYTDETGAALTVGSQQVKDIVTGLIWQRGYGSSKTWSAFFAAGSAQQYCSQLSIGSNGIGSWRLPTIKELSTLADVTVTSAPAIDEAAFPGMPNSYFWSSTVYLPNTGSAWLVGVANGIISYSNIGGTGYAKCVR